jgi:hypothetical protein
VDGRRPVWLGLPRSSRNPSWSRQVLEENDDLLVIGAGKSTTTTSASSVQ